MEAEALRLRTTGMVPMTDHTAHIEECELEKDRALEAWRVASTVVFDLAKTMTSAQGEERRTWAVYERSKESEARARLHAYGVPCPVPECEDGHILLSVLDGTEFSPPEDVTEYCYYCEGRGMVLPAKADAYEGE